MRAACWSPSPGGGAPTLEAQGAAPATCALSFARLLCPEAQSDYSATILRLFCRATLLRLFCREPLFVPWPPAVV